MPLPVALQHVTGAPGKARDAVEAKVDGAGFRLEERPRVDVKEEACGDGRFPVVGGVAERVAVALQGQVPVVEFLGLVGFVVRVQGAEVRGGYGQESVHDVGHFEGDVRDVGGPYFWVDLRDEFEALGGDCEEAVEQLEVREGE